MNTRTFKTKPQEGNASTTLTAAALQDHLVKSLGLGDVLGPRHVGLGPATRAKQKKEIKSTIDTGRFGRNRAPVRKKPDKEKEYVLDPKPPPLSLAQKFGLVDVPDQPLTENDWKKAKDKSNQRDDSKMPCVICKEDFGTQEQVLLSCTHVFHRTCLQAFERFTGKKTCPMCRKEQYQTRVIHEGSRQYRHKCATMIQACWRGYVVRCMYLKLRESNPPKDPKLRQKFYEEKLGKITDRMVRSVDFDVQTFLTEMDTSLAASRSVFRDFDARFHLVSEDEWEAIQLKAVERGETDCPICLTALGTKSYLQKPEAKSTEINTSTEAKSSSNHHSTTKGSTETVQNKATGLNKKAAFKSTHMDRRSGKGNRSTNAVTMDTHAADKSEHCDSQSACRQTVLLSCSHVFHETCLEMFEELAVESNRKVCPVCRSNYQKKVLST